MGIDEEVEVDEFDSNIVAKLPPKKQQEFYDELDRIVKGDEYWFQQRFGPLWQKVYSDTNKYMLEIKEILFKEYERFIPVPCRVDEGELYEQMFERYESNKTS